MSRLDSAIRRLRAQRACLEAAAARIRGRPGVVLELGLGNGRSYDHLRQLLPEREIYAFDRQLACHPDCEPPPERLFLGEMRTTLAAAVRQLGQTAVFIHMDVGSGDISQTKQNVAALEAVLPDLLAAHAVIASDQPLSARAGGRKAVPLPLPAGVPPNRYFLYEWAE